MRAQIVHNESNAFGASKIFFNQPTNAFGPSANHVVILDINSTPAHKRSVKRRVFKTRLTVSPEIASTTPNSIRR